MTENAKIRVLIADDFKLLRNVIRAFLELADDIEVVGEAPDLNDALKEAKKLAPDVIIVNDYLPPVDSAYAARRFRKQGIEAAILTISMNVELDLIQRSLQHGITGFIHKEEIDRLLVEAIRSVHRGERYLSPRAQDAYHRVRQ